MSLLDGFAVDLVASGEYTGSALAFADCPPPPEIRGDRYLSVVMPVYNEERTIESALRVVLEQQQVGKLIVVDDCSNDRTPVVLAQLQCLEKIGWKDGVRALWCILRCGLVK